jgi:hypothetical protein
VLFRSPQNPKTPFIKINDSKYKELNKKTYHQSFELISTHLNV